MNRQNDPLMNSATVQRELERLHKESVTDDCLSVDRMLDHLLTILPADESRAVSVHLERCSACADTLIDLRQAFQPLLHLKQGWGGWQGPLLAAQGRLDAEMQRAWADLCKRDKTTRRRTETLRRSLRWPWPTLTFASWGVTSLLAVAVFKPFSPSRQAIQSAEPSPKASSDELPIRIPKGGTAEETADPGLNLFQSVAMPSNKQMPRSITNWRKIGQEHPALPAPPAFLAQLYARQYRQEKDSVRRATLREQMSQAVEAAQKNLQHLQEERDAQR